VQLANAGTSDDFTGVVTADFSARKHDDPVTGLLDEGPQDGQALERGSLPSAVNTR